MPLAEGWIRLFLQFCLENPLFCNKLRPIALIKNCKEAVRLFFPPNWFPLLFFKRLAFLFASFLDLDRYLPGGVFPLNFCTRLFTNRLPFALCFFPHAENYFSIHAGFFRFYHLKIFYASPRCAFYQLFVAAFLHLTILAILTKNKSVINT